jgi:hypothetical protein
MSSREVPNGRNQGGRTRSRSALPIGGAILFGLVMIAAGIGIGADIWPGESATATVSAASSAAPSSARVTSGLPGYQVVSANGTSARCPGGTKVLGGGGTEVGSHGREAIHDVSSFPSSDGSEWRFSITLDTGRQAPVNTFAVCGS